MNCTRIDMDTKDARRFSLTIDVYGDDRRELNAMNNS